MQEDSNESSSKDEKVEINIYFFFSLNKSVSQVWAAKEQKAFTQ